MSNNSITQLPLNGSMFIIDGPVASLRTAPGQIDATGDQLAMAGDGEEVEKFAFRIDQFDITGNFADVRFKDGDYIEAVVTRIDDTTLYAHAVVRIADGWLWMPNCINKGRWEVAKLNAKIGAGVGIFGWAVLMAFYFLKPLEKTSFGEWAFTMGSVIFVLCTIGAVSVYRSSMVDSLYAESIMSVLGFPPVSG